jgi:hypothetical protein
MSAPGTARASGDRHRALRNERRVELPPYDQRISDDSSANRGHGTDPSTATA